MQLEQIPKREVWTTNLPSLPRLDHFLLILLAVAVVLTVGNFLRRHWSKNNDSVPFPFALMLWLGMFAVYGTVAATLCTRAEPAYRTTIALWCLLGWIPVMAYSSYVVLTSMAMRTLDHIGPFSARIDDPSEFAGARKLAIRGDIDGAISMYRNYPDNQVNALFEAARLLKSEDRYLEAALMFEEIAQRFDNQTRVWADAMYQLAKIKESHLDGRQHAIAIFRQIMNRVPESRFSQLSASELARLNLVDRGYLEELTQGDDLHGAPQDPFYDTHDVRVSVKTSKDGTPAAPKEAGEVPPDPFFSRTIALAAATENVATPKAVRKPAARKAPAAAEEPAAKKTVAKKAAAKKPVAKKPVAKKPAAKKPVAKKPVAKKAAAKKPVAKKKPA